MNHSSIKYRTSIKAKMLTFCLTLLLACFATGTQAKSFKSLSHIDGVTHVHIPKLLIKLAASNNKELRVGKNIIVSEDAGDNILSSISCIDVFTSEEKQACDKLTEKALALTSGKDWETLVSANEDGERVKICQNNSGKKKYVLILAQEAKEVSLVIIKGKLDLTQLIEQAMANDKEDK